MGGALLLSFISAVAFCRAQTTSVQERVIVAAPCESCSSLSTYRAQARYPYLARVAGVEGDVKIQATVGADGAVSALILVSGHPLLVTAAMDAVKQWRYKPDPQRAEFTKLVVVPFRLGRRTPVPLER